MEKALFIGRGCFPELKPLKEDVFRSFTSLHDSLYFLASQYQKDCLSGGCSKEGQLTPSATRSDQGFY